MALRLAPRAPDLPIGKNMHSDQQSNHYEPIDCGHYDYLELACVEGYLLDVITQSGTRQGKALTLRTKTDGEYLIIALGDDQSESIRLDQIQRVVVRSEPRKFAERTFG